MLISIAVEANIRVSLSSRGEWTPEEGGRRTKSPKALKYNRLASTTATVLRSYPRLPVGNSTFPEGSDLRARHLLALLELDGEDGERGRERESRMGISWAPWKFRSCRSPRKYLASARDGASINFRPIFNFSQDALLCHVKQSWPYQSRPLPSGMFLRRFANI